MSWHIEVASKETFRAKVEEQSEQGHQHPEAKQLLQDQLAMIDKLTIPKDKSIHITSSGHIDDYQVVANLSVRTILT